MKPQETGDLEEQAYDHQGTRNSQDPLDSDGTQFHWTGFQNFTWPRFATSCAVSWQPLVRQDIWV